MKNIKLYMLLVLAAWGVAGCDEVAEENRYEQLESVEAKRTVLLEEFTGQRCKNCPEAHRTVSRLKEQYGESLIAVSIHSGGLAIAAPGGLMQPEGNEYAVRWSVEEFPRGVVNRHGESQKHTEWATQIRSELAKEASLEIHLSARISDVDGAQAIQVSTEMLSSLPCDGKLQLWVTESGIRSFQIDGDNYVMDYEHNHVFRACVNGTWGEDVSLPANVYETTEHSIAVQDAWNTDNLSVVGFVYDDSGVLQAAECHVDGLE